MIKKIIIGILIFVMAIFVLAQVASYFTKSYLQEASKKGNIVIANQVTVQMAKEGNLQWFKVKDELHEEYDYIDRLKNSYVHEAVRNKRYELVDYLIKKGKKFNRINNEGYYPIGLAAKNCDLKMVELLRPVSQNERKDSFGKSVDMYLKECK